MLPLVEISDQVPYVGTLEGTKAQDQNREDGVFAMISNILYKME